jgi:N-acetylated-alpha-linked acidic dipeptidase
MFRGSSHLQIYIYDRVENVLPQLSISNKAVDFSPLRHSIKKLQIASFKLDKEKLKAEAKFKKILASLAPPGYRRKNQNQLWRRVRDWIKDLFGAEPPERALQHHDDWMRYLDIDIHNTGAGNELAGHSTEEIGHRPCLISELIKAAKRVSRTNKKLKAFERGFISEGGIKDREWYKHLGVAPGKWLGTNHSRQPATD